MKEYRLGPPFTQYGRGSGASCQAAALQNWAYPAGPSSCGQHARGLHFACQAATPVVRAGPYGAAARLTVQRAYTVMSECRLWLTTVLRSVFGERGSSPRGVSGNSHTWHALGGLQYWKLADATVLTRQCCVGQHPRPRAL